MRRVESSRDAVSSCTRTTTTHPRLRGAATTAAVRVREEARVSPGGDRKRAGERTNERRLADYSITIFPLFLFRRILYMSGAADWARL